MEAIIKNEINLISRDLQHSMFSEPLNNNNNNNKL